jgi:hypothetical protein
MKCWPTVDCRRDVAAFFAHVVQETGDNDIRIYRRGLSKQEVSLWRRTSWEVRGVHGPSNASPVLPPFYALWVANHCTGWSLGWLGWAACKA